MEENNVIVDRYKNDLFDNYYTYLEVIKQLNSSIPDFAENMGFTLSIRIFFEYPEFCRKFLTLLRSRLKNDNVEFDDSIIYHIFEQMMMEKILDNINDIEPSYDNNLDI